LDLSKFQLERVFSFIAGVLPGFVALIIFQMGHREFFERFISLEFLGYKTKIAIVLLVAFVIGNSMTTFVSAVSGAVGGGVGAAIVARQPLRDPVSLEVAPWRDNRWRKLVREQLGATAPDDTQVMKPTIFDQRRRMIDELPLDQRPGALLQLALEKNKADLDDMNWEQWYDQYHAMVVLPVDQTIEAYVGNGLSFNLQAASVYVLISALYVPGVRHWWWLLPSCAWCVIFVAQSYTTLQRFFNKWSTLSDQIKYLSKLPKPR
jgi:hypothetical protein